MSALPETVECDPSKNDIAAKVLKQLEFYFLETATSGEINS